MDVAVGFASANFWSYLILGLFLCVAIRVVVNALQDVSEKNKRPDKYLRLSEKNVRRIQAFVLNGASLLNERQCRDLSSKLSRAFESIQEVVSQCDLSAGLFKPSFKNLHRILEMAELLVRDAGRQDWIAAAAFHIQNDNAFRVILLELGLCYHAIYEQARGMRGSEWEDLCNTTASTNFQPASASDVDNDHEDIRERLEDLCNYQPRTSSRLSVPYRFLLVRLSKKLRLAQYLLLKLQCVPKRSHLVSYDFELSRTMIWTEDAYPFLTWGREVSLGQSGSGSQGVSKTSWLGVPCAKKYGIPERLFLKEAAILSHVNHPNIAKFICCGNKRKNMDHFIAMELMEMSLAKLIEEQADDEAFSHHVAVDIMAQIARGMCCLHGLRVAHRDLKPHNVVLNRLTSSHNEGNYHVKLVDFGVSKTQVEPFRTTTTESGFGTPAFKAPEVRRGPPGSGIGDSTRRAVWFKADVWSFAITCLHILCRKVPPLLHGDADVESVLAPASCPGELVELLQDCLKAVPRDRPDFLEICTRLEKLRHNLLRGGISQEVTASHEFIEKVMCEHFEEQNAGMLLHDDEGEPLGKSISSDTRLLERRGSSCATSRRRVDWFEQFGNEQFKKAREDWLAESKLHAENGRRSRKQSKAFGVDIVTVLGWYIVAEEVLFVSVTETTCLLWWLAFLLSVPLTLFTVLVVIGRFRSVLSLEEDFSSCEHKSMVYHDRAEKLLHKRERFSFTRDVVPDPMSPPPPKQTTLWVFAVLVLFSCLLRWCVNAALGYEALCHSDMIVWALSLLFMSSLSVTLGLLVASSYSVRGSLIIRLLVSEYKLLRRVVWKQIHKIRKWKTLWCDLS